MRKEGIDRVAVGYKAVASRNAIRVILRLA